MKTKLFAVAIAAISCLSASGKDVYFFAENASEATKCVESVTSILIGADKLTLKTANATSTDVAYTDFAVFSFKNRRTSGVGATKADQGTRVTCNGGNVAIASADDISAVEVYAVNGTKVAAFAPASSNFRFTIDYGGMYIVKVKAGDGEKIFNVIK
ncbi:MAG: T9SS type A sorting domain-containing protein [Muribaculaceae bacterium]